MSRLGALALAGAAAAGAAKAYHLATGRDAVLDLRDKLRLGGRSLQAWDQWYAANLRRADIVVCLTTIPSRIGRLPGILKSLLYQSQRPQAIRLHIPHRSRREGCTYRIPDEIQRLQSVEIVRCTDWGPATKLLPALAAFDTEQKILVVDDDRLYPPDLVEVFARWSKVFPQAALGMSGWRVAPDLAARPASAIDALLHRSPAPVKSTRLQVPCPVDVLMGYTGYLVQPGFFDATAVADYSQAPDAAFYVDDIWISAHCRAPKLVVPARRHCFIPRKAWFHYDRTALYRINEVGDPERNNNTTMIRYFRDRWLNAR